MSPRITLVVGASRGIGRELVDQLSQDSNQQVIAGVRKSTDFNNPKIRSVIIDQSDPNSITSAASQVSELDTLILNAAIGDDELILSTSDERYKEYFNINVLGPLRVVKAFLPALRARKIRQIVLISSTSGSLATQVNATVGFRGPYAVSKAAVNMLAVQLHNELREEGFTVVPIHPGWVATDMGNISGSGGMPVAKSASGILKVTGSLKPSDSATFYNWDGSVLPW